MKRSIWTVGIVIAGTFLPTAALAQSSRATSDSWESGEAGYKVGCSTTAAIGLRACDELWNDTQREEIDSRSSQNRNEIDQEETQDAQRDNGVEIERDTSKSEMPPIPQQLP